MPSRVRSDTHTHHAPPVTLNDHNKTFFPSPQALLDAPRKLYETVVNQDRFYKLGKEGKKDWKFRILRGGASFVHGGASAVTYLHFVYKAAVQMGFFQAFARWISPITGIVVMVLETGYDVIQKDRLDRLKGRFKDHDINTNPRVAYRDLVSRFFIVTKDEEDQMEAAALAQITKKNPGLTEKEIKNLVDAKLLKKGNKKLAQKEYDFGLRLRPWMFEYFKKEMAAIDQLDAMAERGIPGVSGRANERIILLMEKVNKQIKHVHRAANFSIVANILTIGAFVGTMLVAPPAAILALTILGVIVKLGKRAVTEGMLDSEKDQKFHFTKCLPDWVNAIPGVVKSGLLKVAKIHYYFQLNVYKTRENPTLNLMTRKKDFDPNIAVEDSFQMQPQQQRGG